MISGENIKRYLVAVVLCITLLAGSWGCAQAAATDKQNTVAGVEAQVIREHSPTAKELKATLDRDVKLKALVEKSLAQAAKINPDRETNPAQTLDEVYDFIDYSLTCMPWNILPNDKYKDFATKCDQSILYIYFLLDQPLTELEGKNLFYNSVQYLEPIYKWLSTYNNSWRKFLETPASWKDEYYQMLVKDPTWNMDKGWYESPNNWKTFNDFFSRKLSSPGVRPTASPENESIVAAPADSLPQGTWKIGKDGTFLADPIRDENGVEIKASTYVSVEQLLGVEGKEFAKHFNKGTLTHTYLNYDDYHRYHVPVSGKVVAKYIVPHANAVGGIVYWNEERQLYVLESNSLSWQAYETRGCVIIDTQQYGLVAILPIGMGQVSSVNFTDNIQVNATVKKGDELGYFLFGGSDCVMLFESKAGFELTAKKGGEGSYSYGCAHIMCGEAYGVMNKTN